jgi:hypothetical protein
MVVFGTDAVETVVNVSVRSVPGVPVPAASSNDPSVPLMSSPSTCKVMVEAPGNWLVNSNQAPSTLPELSVTGTMVAATTAPVESVA